MNLTQSNRLRTLSDSGIAERFNIAEALVDSHIAAGRGMDRAVLYEEQVMTYAELFDRINRAGNVFRDLGVRREDRIGLLVPDNPVFVETFIAAMKIGAVPVP